jgi:hypothetical protein
VIVVEERRTKQVSVFLENKSGRLAEVCQTLGHNGVNIRALCIADTSDFGILRMIVDAPDAAVNCLRDAGFSVGETSVLAVQITDVPGGLGSVLRLLQDQDVNVEYMYAFFTTVEGNAVVVFRVADEQIQLVVDELGANSVPILPSEDVYAL